MNIVKSKSFKSFLILFLIFAFEKTNAIEIFQSTYVKGDGSGKIKITYSAKESDVTKNNSLIGNFPFDAAKIKGYFSSPGNDLKKSEVLKKDGNVYVNAEIDFITVYKIKDMKGFSGTNSSFIKTDTGMVFYWNLKGNQPNQSAVLNKITYVFSFEGDIKSTTGILKNKEVSYYRDTKIGNFNTDLFCTVTVDPVEVKSSDNTKNGSPEENKSCGLFGIELPFILLGGLLISRKLR